MPQRVSSFFIFEVSEQPIILLCDSFKILKVSDKTKEQLFNEDENPTDFTFDSLVADEDKKRVNRALIDIKNKKQSEKIQLRLKNKAGLRWVEFDWQYIKKNGFIYLLGVGSFINTPEEDKIIAFQTAEALKDVELIGKMGSWWVNPKTLENHWSEGNYRIWGADSTKPPPSVSWVLKQIHPEDSSKVLNAIKAVGLNGQNTEINFRMRLDKNLPYRYFFTRVRPWIVNGEVVEIKGVNFEVTDLVQYQIELEKQNESLNRKNGKLSEYVRMNSHDVRGPLSNILSLIELEKHETMNHSEFVNHVKESADKLDSTLRRINEVLLIED